MNSQILEASTLAHQKDFLYTVLNLPRSASQHEIRERHRALSVLFHPDKQQDEHAKDTATKRFLEIQKAYEILSDSFLREVYDTLGEDGLSMKWPEALRSKPPEELREILKKERRRIAQEKSESLIRPRGQLTCGINASSLFEPYVKKSGESLFGQLFHRVGKVNLSTLTLRHSIQKDINEKTKLTVSTRVSKPGGGSILGTVRHQFSPRWSFEATSSILHPHLLIFQTTYRDDENVVVVHSRLMPRRSQLLPPPVTVSLSRKLFRESLTEGTLSFQVGPSPHVTISITSPTPFDLTSEKHDPSKGLPNGIFRPGSVSGFGVGAHFWTYGLTLAGEGSNLKAEWGLTFSELALQVKLGVELGLTGLMYVLTGAWHHNANEIAASVGFGYYGVFLKLDFAYLEQRLSLPIALSLDADPVLALCTTVLPSAAFVLGYHFVLKPRRQAQRSAYFRAARESVHDEKSAVWREFRETASLLQDTAKRHMHTESSKGGLVITEAVYGVVEPDEEAKGLLVDVTVAIQALVHNSQVYIPGHRQKSAIQGFYDPAPSAAKSLRIRYLFRDREHYAEIADSAPVVLPLADHLVMI